MELKDIKKGDILTTKYFRGAKLPHLRDYIVFIANGDYERNQAFEDDYCIHAIAMVNLNGKLMFSVGDNKKSVGYQPADAYSQNRIYSILRKATLTETLELMEKLKGLGFIYDRKKQELKRIGELKK